MAKGLTIFIPAYDQLPLLERCLSSLARQTRQDFRVIIEDDASPADYSGLAAKFPRLDIEVRRNEKNRGALGNMIYCLTAEAETDFILVIHEDDFLQQEYLERGLNILEDSSGVAFVASPASFFPPGKNVVPPATLSPTWKKYSREDFVGFILSGNRFAFGSIIYRRELIRAGQIDFKSYNAFFDRPFLLQILKDSEKTAAVMLEPYYYYQEHPWPDKRWRELSFENVFNLYNCYETLAPGKGRAIASQYFFDFAQLERRRKEDWKDFWRRGRSAGLLSFRLSGKFLAAGLFILIGGRKSYHRLFNLLKKRQ